MKHSKNIDDLLRAGVDGQLIEAEERGLQERLASDPELAAQFHALQRQSDLIRSAVPAADPAHMQALIRNAQPQATYQPSLRLAASVVIFGLGIGLGYLLPRDGAADSQSLMIFAQQAQAAHALYVSEVLHPVEVEASERDHLQSWLSNRLGAAIIAPQLGDTGFSLIGGRLLPAGENASALFMYENSHGDRLSLLATHSGSDENQSFRFQSSEDFLTIFWQDGPWKYSLVGAAPRETMDEVARSIHGQMI